MGLQRDIVAIPLVGGLDTKTEATVVVPGQLTVCENGEFTKGGSLRKRAGHTATPAELTDGTPITDAVGLASLKDGWVLLGRRNAYALDSVRNAWTVLGPYTPITYKASEIANAASEQTQADLASVNGITVVAWEDSRGGIRFSVFDDESGAALLSEVVVASANVVRPLVTVVGPNILVTWHDSATTAINARVVQTANAALAATTANIVLAANANVQPRYDVIAGDGVAFLEYRQDAAAPGGDIVQLAQISSAGVVLRQVTAHAVAAIAVQPALGWDSANNVVYSAIRFNALSLEVSKFDGADLTFLDTDSVVAADVVRVGISPNSLGGASVWFTEAGLATENNSVVVKRLDAGLNVIATSTTRHAQLATAPWWDGHSSLGVVAYAGVGLTNLQGGYYFQRDDGVVIGRVAYGSGDLVNNQTPHVKLVGPEQYAFALGYRRQVPVNLAKVTGASIKMTPVFQHHGIKRVDVNTAPKLTPVEIGGVLYTNGAWLWAIDGGGAPTEAQSQMFPDVAVANHVTAVGGNLTASASYIYRWYYEWTNAHGQRVRSVAVNVNVATTAANFQFNITLPTLAFTRTGARSPVAIVGYRSEANNPNFFYRVTNPDPSVIAGNNRYVANNVAADTVSFTDNLSDASLGGREIDYQSNGETTHIAFDGPAAIGEAGNRLWCVGGGERPDRPQFSLLRTDGAPIEANDVFVVTEFPEDGGATVAVSQVNGTPIVFKERAIYLLEGTGPANNGVAAEPYLVKQVSSDVGCIEPRSVLATHDGIYFKSAKGIYLLGQNLVPRYIGAFVEAYNSQNVTGAAVVPDTNQCVFLTSAGLTVMYDYFYDKWSTYTNHQGLSLAAGIAGFAYLRTDGALFIRDPASADLRVHTDAGVPYSLRFRVGMRLDETVQGFWICRKLMAYGKYVSAHELEIRIFRNRELWANQIVVWQPDLRMGQTVWGSDTVWGDPTSAWGGIPRSNEYSFDTKLKARKVSTVSFEFTDRPGSPPGASYEMFEIALEVYSQAGLARMPATRKL